MHHFHKRIFTGTNEKAGSGLGKTGAHDRVSNTIAEVDFGKLAKLKESKYRNREEAGYDGRANFKDQASAISTSDRKPD